MKSPFATAMEGLSRIRGVSGAMVVGESDGLIVDAALQSGERGDVVAALAASLYRRARLSSSSAGLGEISFLQLDAERGRVFVAGAGELVLVLIAEPRANVGLIRMDMLREVEALR